MEKNEPEFDPVSRPSHYCQGEIQCVDALRAALTPEEFKGFLRANCIKYLWRGPHKGNEVQDYEKAAWYLSRLISAADHATNAGTQVDV